MEKKQIEIFYPTSRTDWRKWLQKNHLLKQSVWLVLYKKSSSKHTITWREAVDEGLCFAWIDSKKIAIDKEKSHQFFTKRKPKGTWSKINKEKVTELIEQGLMTKAGLEIIDIAKQNGSWNILDDVEELLIPQDLEDKLKLNDNAMEVFLSLSKSVRKAMLHRLLFARRVETRQKRLAEIIEFIINLNNK